MSDIISLNAQSVVVNNDIERVSKNLILTKNNLVINSRSAENLKEAVSKAKSTQKAFVVAYENDNKRFNAIVRYGDILRKIEQLMNILPSNTDNLSLEELYEKLQELKNSRKRNFQQLSFMFYQNMLTDLLTNIANIEKDFQAGSLSSVEALSRVKEAKSQIKENAHNMPPVMNDSIKQASNLVKMYETGFSTIVEKTNNLPTTPLVESKLKLYHQVMFETLNNNTTDLLNKVEDLDKTLSNFEPQVNLDKLLSGLENTQSLLDSENWTADDLEITLSDLELTTDSLTSEQTEKNNISEKLATDVKDLTKHSEELSKTSTQNVTEETFKEANLRAQQSIANVKTMNKLQSNDSVSVNFQTEYAEITLSQLEVDQKVSDVVSIDPNAATSFKNKDLNKDAQQEVTNLQEKIEQQELEQGHIKHLENDGSIDDDEEKKKRELLERLKNEDPNNSQS